MIAIIIITTTITFVKVDCQHFRFSQVCLELSGALSHLYGRPAINRGRLPEHRRAFPPPLSTEDRRQVLRPQKGHSDSK